ncbi:MAG TPA: HDOD domain-containing protein [Spirochaetota bacterium]|nr:HDOD domain-containing protein [Spirochaetota bacterium]HQO39289.1 HDOD domain-containing protein [Spirochaetota bacterium]
MTTQHKKIIFDKIVNREPVRITFKYASDDLLILINAILVRMLICNDQLYLMNSLLTMVRELVVNALKANAKRIYFKKKNLDINNSSDYSTGRASFKEEIIGDFDFIRSDIVQSDYSVNLNIIPQDDRTVISVRNNAAMLPVEQERINKRLALALACESFGDIYDQVEDDTEGAGLGLVLIIMFIKSMGLNTSAFSITSDEDSTVSSITIPLMLKPVEITTPVKKHILRAIDGLPTFPENVMQLINMCASEDASIDDIASRIKRDVALSTDVLRLSNSAGFATVNKVDDIGIAILKIGLKNVRAILIASTARRILESRFRMFEEIWEHCNRTAYYSRMILVKNKKIRDCENAYMAGLLHDLGQIILMAIDMKTIQKISYITRERSIINSTVMEELAIGISHAEIGALVAEKWKFPQILVEIIRYHHAPLRVSRSYSETAYAVYLANMLCGIEKKKYIYNYLEDQVLEFFGINSGEELAQLHNTLRSEYENLQKPR